MTGIMTAIISRLIVGKNRNGPVGTIHVIYKEHSGEIIDLDAGEEIFGITDG